MICNYSQLKLASLTKEEVRKSPFSKTWVLLLNYKNPQAVPQKDAQKILALFRNETTIPEIDDTFKDPVYFAEHKNRKVKVIFLTPSDYLKACAKNRGFDSEQTERGEVNEAKVQTYVEDARRGEKFPALSLNLVTGDQEGRHRARVAEETGVAYVPVFVYDYYQEPEK